jgi:hypothetical protein
MKFRTRARTLRAAIQPKAPTPLGALARGLLAGAAGAGIQSLFFRATAKLTPKPTQLPSGEGKPVDEAHEKSSLDTVARRWVEHLMRRGPIENKQRAGQLVHYAFGAGWGGLYGLWRESTRVSPLLFGALVWMLSDNLILPAFRLAAWPNRYSLKEHHYALQAHFAYGLGTAATYALLRDFGAVPLGALPAIAALQLRAWALRTPPGRLVQAVQPAPSRAINHFLDRVARA